MYLIVSECSNISYHSVTVSLKPAGDAPTLNKSKFLVESDKTVGWLHQWLRKAIKCEPDESTVSTPPHIALTRVCTWLKHTFTRVQNEPVCLKKSANFVFVLLYSLFT